MLWGRGLSRGLTLARATSAMMLFGIFAALNLACALGGLLVNLKHKTVGFRRR